MQTIQEIINRLIELDLSIATAESITGGCLSHLITNCDNSSKCFKYGIISYSNEAKIKILNVDTKIIDEYGVISSQTAQAMAQGIKDISKADICVSVTGNAASSNQQDNKATGLSFICIILFDKIYQLEYQSKFLTKNEIKLDTSIYILNQVYKLTKELKK